MIKMWGPGDWLKDRASEIIENIAANIAEAVGDTLFSMGTLWVGIDPPQITSGERNPTQPADALSAGPNASGLEVIASYTMWIGLTIFVMSLIILSVRHTVLNSQGEARRTVGKIGWVLGATIIISASGAVVGALLGRMPLQTGGATGFIQNSLWWYTLIAAIVGVVIGAIRMAWEQRAEPGKDTMRGILTLIVVVGAGATVVNFGIQAADGFSRWILDQSLVSCKVSDDGCFGGTITKLLGVVALGFPPSIVIMLMIVLVLLSLLISIIQIILMLARSGILVVLVGVLPLSASFTTTEMGRTWFKRTVAWIIAFILYKPVAAIVYAAAIRLISANDLGSGDDEITTVITGILLMALAVVALPALIRLIAPAVGAVAGGAGGGVMMAAAGAA